MLLLNEARTSLIWRRWGVLRNALGVIHVLLLS